MTAKVLISSDGVTRCSWPGNNSLYINYHDEEWGFPEGEDVKIFEKISLEGFQSGLSWITILKKRQYFREAFFNFDLEIVSNFGEREIKKLLCNENIVRHEGKIRSVVNNAQRALMLIESEGSLKHYFYSEPEFTPLDETESFISSKTEKSEAISKDLKKRGWTWLGPTTIYSFMQAMGVVNDHHRLCDLRKIVEIQREKFFH